jgi:hypothetical protein
MYNIRRIVTPFIPIYGMGAYIIIFTTAAILYPGGSVNYPNASGYSFFHNFLCDAMLPITPKGVENTARTLAVISHLVLSFTMIVFFYILPEIFSVHNRNTKMIRWFGMLTMSIFIFMYTPYHDYIVTVTGILGTFALLPFFIELYRYSDKRLKRLAYVCYAFSIVVFFVFETKLGYFYLPFLQKITFFLDAWWVIWISLIVVRKRQQPLQVQCVLNK